MTWNYIRDDRLAIFLCVPMKKPNTLPAYPLREKNQIGAGLRIATNKRTLKGTKGRYGGSKTGQKQVILC